MDSTSCDPNDFKNACSRFPSGVTVTTVIGENGLPYGITVSSFTSVSLSPPLVLACIGQRSAVLQHFNEGKYFGVNVLGARQRELSIKFSRDCNSRFAGVEWYAGHSGVPLFFEVAASFECRILQVLAAGDHSIVLGMVLHARSGDGAALAYVDRCYGTIADLQTA